MFLYHLRANRKAGKAELINMVGEMTKEVFNNFLVVLAL